MNIEVKKCKKSNMFVVHLQKELQIGCLGFSAQILPWFQLLSFLIQWFFVVDVWSRATTTREDSIISLLFILDFQRTVLQLIL